jgi:hypothetical protein
MQIYGADIGQQRNGSSTLDSVGQGSLVFCTTTGYASGNYFSALSDKMLQRFWILIIDDQTCICTKAAYFAPVVDAFFSLWSSCGSAGIDNHFI